MPESDYFTFVICALPTLKSSGILSSLLLGPPSRAAWSWLELGWSSYEGGA